MDRKEVEDTMAIVIGVFPNEAAIPQALEVIGRLGVAGTNVSLLVPDQMAPGRTKPIFVSGFLERILQPGELRTREGRIASAMAREGVNQFDMAAYMAAVKRGYAVVIARVRPAVAPWAAEAMRRAGAVAAMDTETRRQWQVKRQHSRA